MSFLWFKPWSTVKIFLSEKIFTLNR
uniref:Uncharacterized protein n=1 Tax=Lepeophtheirus salmonis TaxID=72036 RepID=A0A0K2U1W7_LEPSM